MQLQQQHEQWVNQVVERRDIHLANPDRLPNSLLNAFVGDLHDLNSPYSELAVRLIMGAFALNTEVTSFAELTDVMYAAFADFHAACIREYQRRQRDYPKNVLPIPLARWRA